MTFKFANDAVYQEALKDLTGGTLDQAAGYLSWRYQTKVESYEYVREDSRRKVRLLWNYPEDSTDGR